MFLISYDGIAFASLNAHGGLPWATARGQWSLRTLMANRRNALPVITGAEVMARSIPAQFVYEGTDPIEEAIDALLGALQPTNPTPRTLVAQRGTTANPGVLVERLAVVELDNAGGGFEPHVLPVRFVSADPVWYEQSAATANVAIAVAASDDDVAVANDGQAPVNPLIRFAPSGFDPASASGTARRTFSITWNGDGPLNNWPSRLDLGDTSAWGFFGSGHDDVVDEFYVFRDGLQVPREPINLDSPQSYCWLLLDDIQGGETAEYTITYNGNALTDPPLTMSGIGNTNRPAFDTSWEKGDVASATVGTLTVAGTPWQTNQWQLGYVEIISGAGSGAAAYQVVSNTTNTLTVSGWSAGTPTSASDYLVYKSKENEFLYDLRQVERSDPERGLWYTSGAGQSPPQEVRFDTPGSWYLGSLVGNNDERVAKEVTPFNPGGTTDYIAGLDVNRTWQGGSSYGKGAKKHDAVFFDSPVPITSLRANFEIKNPNGMAKGFIGAKEGAGADYEAILEHTTASDTLTAIASATYAMPADTHHLAIGLVPRNDREIPLSWATDDGTATSATSTTLTDATKAWTVDQWINATVRVVSGTGAGQARTVTDSDATSVTVASWPNGTPDATSRYQIRQKSNDATFRHEDTDPQFRLIIDTSDIVASAISAEADNYVTRVTFRLDGDASAALPYRQITVGTGDRALMLAGTEELRIDCVTRRASIHVAATGALVRTLGGGYVRAEAPNANDDDRLDTDWLPLTPGAHAVWVLYPSGTAYIGSTTTVEWVEGWFGG